jgi:hypothetical protein
MAANAVPEASGRISRQCWIVLDTQYRRHIVLPVRPA